MRDLMTNKDEITRFGVSMPQELVEQFEVLIPEQGYSNRSEAIRDLVRKALIQPDRMKPELLVAGTIQGTARQGNYGELPSFGFSTFDLVKRAP
jgi:metal-responsive CopG/Arc/MetJ family transcriptional regulator